MLLFFCQRACPCLVLLVEVFEAEAELRLLPREVVAAPPPQLSPPTPGYQPVEHRRAAKGESMG